MQKILVVEDEADIAELIQYNLELAKFNVRTAASGEEVFDIVKEFSPDLILLDLMLPGLSGLEVCKRIKQTEAQETPIIMVTAKGEENDIITGLELGADDYVTKPFSPQVLVARAQAVLRRSRKESDSEVDDSHIVKLGELEIDPGRVEVKIKGEKVDLTQSEFRILQFLAQRPGWVYTRAQIVQAIHGSNYAVTDRTIDFQMVGLRKKLGPVGDRIETVRGVGYRFKESS